MPLELTPDEFRALAARVVEDAAGYLTTLGERPIVPPLSGLDSLAAFGAPIPEQGLGPAAFDDLARVAAGGRAGSGGFFGYVLGSGDPVAALADLFASVVNQNVTAWRSSPSGITIERAVVASLASALGCESLTGSLTSGGSAANLMALAMARESRLPANEDGVRPGVVYASDEVHMSIPKALALLGLGRSSLRLLPADDAFRLPVGDLRAAIEEDRAAGRHPLAIVASAGTTTTGAVDPLDAIADLADEHDLWLHVDGAYGAPAALVDPARFAGLGRADSISLDAHKWLYQPLDVSLLLYRDAALARQTFAYTADYARSLSDDPVEGFSIFEESLELSRRFRALKLWLSLRYHGLGAFREAIRRDLAHAQELARLVDAEPRLERLAPVELSAVCFRVRNADNAAILHEVNRSGRVYLSNATVRGEFVLRACFVNHRTTGDDVNAIVSEVLAHA